MPEHVHLLISLRNIDNYSSFLRQVKANSSLWVNKTFPNLPRFEWQQGFGSYTLHFSMIETVRNYIRNQEKHHATMTYEEEYLKFLNGKNIEYDPRFVFD
jgi:REP element-mobilizing transposase RayT